MRTVSVAWAACGAAVLVASAGGCGGITTGVGTDGGIGPSSGGSTSSSGGGASSSSSGGFASSASSGGVSSGSSSGGVSSSSSSGGVSSSSSSGGVSSSSSSGGVSSSSSSGGSSSGPVAGELTFEQCVGTGPLCSTPTFYFYGIFSSDDDGTQGCTITTSGSCGYYDCTGSTSAPTGVSAGTLTISGGSLSGPTSLQFASPAYSDTLTGTFFSAGQTLTVLASGSTIPAFGPQSVVAPAMPVLTKPVASGTTFTIPTDADLSVAWTGGAGGAQMFLEGVGGSGGQSYLFCSWDATLGAGTVPAEVLKPLSGQSGGYLVYGQQTTTSFDAGGTSVTVSALPYSGDSATFQ